MPCRMPPRYQRAAKVLTCVLTHGLQGRTMRSAAKPFMVKADLLPSRNQAKAAAASVPLDKAKPVQLVAFGDIDDAPIIRVHVCNPEGRPVEQWSTARPDAPE